MIRFEKVSKYEDQDVVLPVRSTGYAAGYDFANNTGKEIMIRPRTFSDVIPTGVKANMPADVVLKLFPRSSHGFKFGIRLANTAGIIDADYYNNEKNEGEIFVKLYNPGDEYVVFKPGERFVQGIFERYLLVEGDSYGEGDLRCGGIGSTT